MMIIFLHTHLGRNQPFNFCMFYPPKPFYLHILLFLFQMLRVHLYYYTCVVYSQSQRFRNKSCTFILLYISKTQRLLKLSNKYTKLLLLLIHSMWQITTKHFMFCMLSNPNIFLRLKITDSHRNENHATWPVMVQESIRFYCPIKVPARGRVIVNVKKKTLSISD
jgi:hypothetical protein